MPIDQDDSCRPFERREDMGRTYIEDFAEDYRLSHGAGAGEVCLRQVLARLPCDAPRAGVAVLGSPSKPATVLLYATNPASAHL